LFWGEKRGERGEKKLTLYKIQSGAGLAFGIGVGMHLGGAFDVD
jgi:hypothetical protein